MKTKNTCHDSLKLDNQLCHRLYVISNALTRAYRPYLAHLNLTYPQYIVMMALWETDAVEVCQLQSRTLIDAGALSLILKKLTQKQLLTVTQSPSDKRRKIIQLTTVGQQLQQTALDFPQRVDCDEMTFDDDDRVELVALLDKLKGDLLGQQPTDSAQ